MIPAGKSLKNLETHVNVVDVVHAAVHFGSGAAEGRDGGAADDYQGGRAADDDGDDSDDNDGAAVGRDGAADDYQGEGDDYQGGRKREKWAALCAHCRDGDCTVHQFNC